MDKKNRKPQVDTARAAGTPAAAQDAPMLTDYEREALKAKLRKEVQALSDEECAIIASAF